MRLIYTDVSTAPIDGAVDYLPEPDEPEVPGNYKKPESIAKWIAEDKPRIIAEAKRKLLDKAALDPDLCRISGIGLGFNNAVPVTMLCRTEDEEHSALLWFAQNMRQQIDAPPATLVGFNSMRFDWPVLMRRARYLNVKLTISIDRYRSSNIDVSELITNKGQQQTRSLGFYCKRLGWTDLCKPLDGAEEARVFDTGRWDELAASLQHDVEATRRLHQWWEQRA
jgi:hypothetical protein